jgi:DNA-binding transcriptional ArsR family regulator
VTKPELIRAICHPRVPDHLLRTLSACELYTEQTITTVELAKLTGLSDRSVRSHLRDLERLGAVATERKGNRGLIVVTKPVPDWPGSAPAPTAPLADVREFLPDALKTPEDLPPNVTRDYAEELGYLDSHPTVAKRISVQWLARLERKWGDRIKLARLTLAELCDSFVNDYLRNTGTRIGRDGKARPTVAAAWLADPATNWEKKFETHIMRHVAPQDLAKARQDRLAAQRSTAQANLPFRHPHAHRSTPSRPAGPSSAPSGATPSSLVPAGPDPIENVLKRLHL